MEQKRLFFTEAAYFCGIIILAFGTALMEKADFGMSMVVALAYLLHLKFSQYYAWFSFGVAEYVLQAFLVLIVCIVMRKFKISYLFSFITALIYGTVLDLWMQAVSFLPNDTFVARIILFVVGMLCGAIGVTFFFNTYLAPEAYELLVREISHSFNKKISRVKTIYDCSSLTISILLSFVFFGLGHFVGVNIGTVICALVNGFLIGKCSEILSRYFSFKDAFQFRALFEK